MPDPARGEFVNIGAVAGSDDAAEWELRLVSNLSRAKALDDRGVLSKAFEFAASLEDSIATLDDGTFEEDVEGMSSTFLRRLSEDMQNVVQLSTPAPIAADAAEAALDLVFDQLVLDAAKKSFPFEKKHRAQGAVRKAYRSHAVPSAAIRERAAVRSGVFDGVFDFAVHNGRTVQLVQCWSFQLPNQSDLAEQVKAWSWLVHEIRRSGGELTYASGEASVPQDLDIFAVTIPPRADVDAPAYVEAQAAFAEIGVTEVRPDDADRLGVQAADALAAPA